MDRFDPALQLRRLDHHALNQRVAAAIRLDTPSDDDLADGLVDLDSHRAIGMRRVTMMKRLRLERAVW
jgi:hypothetical protein